MQPRTRLACGNQKKPWSAVEFGTIYTIDDKLTVTSDPNSAQLGRAQGIYVNSEQDSNDPALHLIFSVVFTNKDFNGSTLEIQGADKLFERKREVSEPGNFGWLEVSLLLKPQRHSQDHC
ncbi:hypothetical protein EZV62_020640 [Acer yangbiense]|uniref:Dirigent protein n=1 Tax=Acer yangbiense TaxID=1000413 RepID=A0A5C7HEF0_9ROSI|nr:hypothetical protein EZV62_020640 [Acer yangbiense]